MGAAVIPVPRGDVNTPSRRYRTDPETGTVHFDDARKRSFVGAE
jgi:hypothetical protein